MRALLLILLLASSASAEFIEFETTLADTGHIRIDCTRALAPNPNTPLGIGFEICRHSTRDGICWSIMNAPGPAMDYSCGLNKLSYQENDLEGVVRSPLVVRDQSWADIGLLSVKCSQVESATLCRIKTLDGNIRAVKHGNESLAIDVIDNRNFFNEGA